VFRKTKRKSAPARRQESISDTASRDETRTEQKASQFIRLLWHHCTPDEEQMGQHLELRLAKHRRQKARHLVRLAPKSCLPRPKPLL
jgi:hypothetical protein